MTVTELATLTPMMRQYYELKHRCGDAILFFRMGDFYEIFGTDAEEVAPLLELVLTSRERGDQQRIPFCGVPHHSARGYWLKLLKRGYKVALADQVEDPAEAKGLVKRDIVRTLTPGCIDDLEGLEQDAPNYVLAIYEEPGQSHWACALADLSTGELRLGRLDQLAEVRPIVERLRPKELLARQFFHDELRSLLAPNLAEQRLLLEPLPEAPLRDKSEQKALLLEVFGKQDLASQPCGQVPGGEALITALLVYFRSLQASLAPFMTVRPLVESHVMSLDETALRDLEVFETVRRRQTQGSLFREINRTLSPMGARLLRYFLAHPLLDQAQIRGRHSAVRSLIALGEADLAELRQYLKSLPDLERLSTRIFAGAASPSELARALVALRGAQWILEHSTGERGEKLPAELFKAVATGLKFFKGPARLLNEALEDSPAPLGSGIGVLRPGFDAELDRLNALSRTGAAQVEAYQEALRQRTGIGSLKIKDHKAFGLLIEVTKPNLSKVPADFIRRQTMVNCERFVTIELQELGEELSQASAQAVQRESELYQKLLSELGRFRMDIKSVAQALATFDLLQSFAWLALKNHYCEPKIADDNRLELRGSRHPVVERYVGRHAFTANDILMTPQQKHLLITGPNMAGKSTVMRQTAIAAILCQIGSFVPAQAARLPVFDRIFTRVGAADDLSRGQSTFMVEMSEAANILRNATQKSLVILDEVGRGTSTQDGLAIASAILLDLTRRVRCYSLFATHYHELVPLAESLASVRLVQTEVVEANDRVVFTHRLKDGASDSSYGIEVARIAGLPDTVLAEASKILAAASASATSGPKDHKGKSKAAESRPLKGASVRPLESLGLNSETPEAEAGFSHAHPGEGNERLSQVLQSKGLTQAPQSLDPVLERLRERLTTLNLNRLTPLQALNILSELQASLTNASARSLFPEQSC